MDSFKAKAENLFFFWKWLGIWILIVPKTFTAIGEKNPASMQLYISNIVRNVKSLPALGKSDITWQCKFHNLMVV